MSPYDKFFRMRELWIIKFTIDCECDISSCNVQPFYLYMTSNRLTRHQNPVHIVVKDKILLPRGMYFETACGSYISIHIFYRFVFYYFDLLPKLKCFFKTMIILNDHDYCNRYTKQLIYRSKRTHIFLIA